MEDAILVDSSVWVRHLKMTNIIEPHAVGREVVTCPPVVQEVLQGIFHPDAYRARRRMFLLMRILDSPMSADVFLEAADIYRNIRGKGFTIRSPNDCLIAACAIRNGVPLLHADRDFDVIARFTMLQAVNLSAR